MDDNQELKTVESSENNEVKTYTEDQVKEQIQKAVQDRLNRERKKYEGFDEMKSQYEELKKFKEEQELASMTELEKLQKQLESEQKEKETYLNQFSQLEQQLKQERLNSKFKEVASSKGIKYLDDALKLSDLSQIEVNSDGFFVGIEEVVQNLIETKPFLLNVEKPAPAPIGGSSNPPQGPSKTGEQLIAEAAEKYKRTNKPDDYIMLLHLKRKYGK